jgi:hypothetical protein
MHDAIAATAASLVSSSQAAAIEQTAVKNGSSIRRSSIDGGVITLIPTLHHIVMDLWVTEGENDSFAIVMKAVCSPVMTKEGSALAILVVYFLLHYRSDAYFY